MSTEISNPNSKKGIRITSLFGHSIVKFFVLPLFFLAMLDFSYSIVKIANFGSNLNPELIVKLIAGVVVLIFIVIGFLKIKIIRLSDKGIFRGNRHIKWSEIEKIKHYPFILPMYLFITYNDKSDKTLIVTILPIFKTNTYMDLIINQWRSNN